MKVIKCGWYGYLKKTIATKLQDGTSVHMECVKTIDEATKYDGRSIYLSDDCLHKDLEIVRFYITGSPTAVEIREVNSPKWEEVK